MSPQPRPTERTTRWRAYDARRLALGPVHLRIDRSDGKHLFWEDGHGHLGLNGHRVADLLYMGESLAGAPRGSLLVVTEGEKAADAVRAAGFQAVGIVCGASATPGDLVIGLLKDFDGVLWPDADVVGRGLMSRVAERAERLGVLGLRLVEPPADSPQGWDAANADPDLIAELITAARSLPMLPPQIRRIGMGDFTTNEDELSRSRAAADIIPKRVQWLWPARIAFGKLTVLDGRPGVGKSAICLDLTARVTSGRAMPGEPELSKEPRNALIVTAEDDWEDTVVPRLMAAGADLSRVYRLDDLDIPNGVSALEDRIIDLAVELVVIDPLVAFVPSKFNLYRDQDARAALKPLAKVAGRTGAAIVGLRHVNKAQGVPAQDRGTGSVAIGGAARSNLIAGPDPDREGQFVLAAIKNNLGPKASSLGYSLEPADVHLADGPASVVSIRWQGEVDVDADDLVVGERQGEAATFIEEQLAGGPKPSNDIKEAAESRGLSWSGAVRRASKRLRVVKYSTEVGKPGAKWMWRLPDR